MHDTFTNNKSRLFLLFFSVCSFFIFTGVGCELATKISSDIKEGVSSSTSSTVITSTASSQQDTHPTTASSTTKSKPIPPPKTTARLDTCSAIRNTTFYSVEDLEVGLTPDGLAMGKWSISFREATSFPHDKTVSWHHSDTIESGTYTCTGSKIIVTMANKLYDVIYEEATGRVIFDGVVYERTRQNGTNVSNKKIDATFELHFSIGGSIFGSSFEVTIVNNSITYLETARGGAQKVKKVERTLSREEMDELRQTVTEANLLTLSSQNFTKQPLVPDQAAYRVSVLHGDRKNNLACGVPLPDKTMNNCQKQIDLLRLKLNSLLGVNMY